VNLRVMIVGAVFLAVSAGVLAFATASSDPQRQCLWVYVGETTGDTETVSYVQGPCDAEPEGVQGDAPDLRCAVSEDELDAVVERLNAGEEVDSCVLSPELEQAQAAAS
jgi:hypothetical protein